MICSFVGVSVEAKSTMELLINKNWHEFDFGSMKARDDYYVRYTGTQRMIVGADSVGKQKMRVIIYRIDMKRSLIPQRWGRNVMANILLFKKIVTV